MNPYTIALANNLIGTFATEQEARKAFLILLALCEVGDEPTLLKNGLAVE